MRYAHTNLVAEDWKKLAGFYMDVFDCEVIPVERDLHGNWLEEATGLQDAHIQGIHLRLPGYKDNGPTLEIFQYKPVIPSGTRAINRPGLAHLAFECEDVSAAVQKVLASGGSAAGEIVNVDVPGAGRICFAYVRDPEDNLIEIQSWLAKE